MRFFVSYGLTGIVLREYFGEGKILENSFLSLGN